MISCIQSLSVLWTPTQQYIIDCAHCYIVCLGLAIILTHHLTAPGTSFSDWSLSNTDELRHSVYFYVTYFVVLLTPLFIPEHVNMFGSNDPITTMINAYTSTNCTVNSNVSVNKLKILYRSAYYCKYVCFVFG